jgi:colanic acid biosynthesis glycosyl transferase WcaI
MRLLLYGLNFAPEPVGIGKYTGEMARWLAGRGHQVKVICAPPYYPDWRVSEGWSARAYRRESVAGVQVLRCPIWIPKRVTGARRLLHLMSFALSSVIPMLLQSRWRPDVVVTIEPPLFAAPAALLCARLSGARAWLHIQDFEVDAAFDLGLLKSQLFSRLAFRTERLFMQRFDRISTISEKMVGLALQKTAGKKDCFLFPNWVDTDRIFPMHEPSPYRKKLGIAADTVVLLYSGSMGAKQGLEVILAAADALRHEPRYIFVMAGAGHAYQSVRDAADRLANMLWLPLQPTEQLNAFLNLADIHLLPQRADAADLVMPSKLTGMLATGRPVIATAPANTQLARVVQGKGVVVPPGSPSDFAAAISHLGRDTAARKELGRAARAYACDALARERVLRGFECELQAMLATSGSSPQLTAREAPRPESP